MQNHHLKLAIIGAGPAGLVSTRHLSQSPNLQITVFEANKDIGGLWVYDERTDADPKFDSQKTQDPYYKLNGGYHSSMYTYLQSNLPYFYDAFKDLAHPDVDPNFPMYFNIHQQKQYLDAYAEKFGLRKYIQLNTLVQSVRLYENLTPEEQSKAPEQRKFLVQTVKEDSIQYHVFDYVLVATGHHTKPYIPEIAGIEKFKGKILAAKDFKNPDAEYLKEKKVMILGSSFSATDLAVQMLENPYVGPQPVDKIMLVGRKLGFLGGSEDLKPFIERGKLSVFIGEIKQVLNENTVELSDGTTREVDTIIFATGYKFSFQFLDLEKDKFIDFDPNQSRGKFLGPIYKRFICIREPDFFFVGNLDAAALSFSIFEIHAMIIKHIIEGKIKLPSKEKMTESFLQDLDDLRHKHKMPMENTQLPPIMMDVPYWKEMKDWLAETYPSDEKKRQEFDDAMVKTYQQMGQIFFSGNIISVKKFDYNTIFPRDLRNTTEFA